MMTSETTGVNGTREGADAGAKPAALARVLLAGVDTLYFSCEATISEAMRKRLAEEKQVAQLNARTREVHCPEWLGARVAPQGARGGYAFLLETEDFAVKLLGEHIVNRPGIYIELRSHVLHTHPEGARGACEAVLAWVHKHLLADQDEAWVRERVSVAMAKVSRVDIHVDWQGGYAPTLDGGSRELRAFMRPGKTKWGFYGQGLHPTGYTFGRGHVQARLYNKTLEGARMPTTPTVSCWPRAMARPSTPSSTCGGSSSNCGARG
jgi:hypothetical protein